ncbi:bifunctional DNA primase/polymerase [Streptomyces sp. 4N509B]|uniref:bifunctional DNA primase/polymerase n=1 Tax=Streptomyces sp. 4N509B TaxID=3457413 RepID=UPI003FD34C76
MGFTIGGPRGGPRERRLTARRTERPRRPGRRPQVVGTAVAEYTGLWGWDVVLGAGVRRSPGRAAPGCSCGRERCPAPGAHPLASFALIPAGTPLTEAMDAWSDAAARTPGVTVLLPTGTRFDVIEVPSAAARCAVQRMERMGLPLGPVAVAPHGRAWFLVAPGAAAALPELLYRTGWDGAALDLRAVGPGGHITAPPSDHGGHGPVRWLRPPTPKTADTAASPPHARLLLGTLAYVCRRAALRPPPCPGPEATPPGVRR